MQGLEVAYQKNLQLMYREVESSEKEPESDDRREKWSVPVKTTVAKQ